MNQNEELITKFYTAFANTNADGMAKCYHQDIRFQDPAFGILKEIEVASMWKMLLERANGNIKIEFSDVIANQNTGQAKWIATYLFSQTNRKVVNKIEATFEFKDGLIIKHTDHFNLYKWTKQALGFKGLLLGWTNFMKNKIQKSAKKSLEIYIQKPK
jgi:ketosteroid isomerase-like protein